MNPRERLWMLGWYIRRDSHECSECRKPVNVRPWQRCPHCRERWP